MRKIAYCFTSMLMFVLLTASSKTIAQVSFTVAFAPPALPVYEQPVCPGDNYIWVPGYWAWDPDYEDYYWVPGTWVLAPEVGYLWTPPWWGWGGGGFVFHEGYWGPHVGFYGGVNYGFGYFGTGYVGGRWNGGHFFYNRSVTNVNVVNIHNVYNERINNVTVNRVSYNGGAGGLTARPTPQEETADRDRHMAPVAAQTQHVNAARGNRELRASVNQGKPAVAATARPGEFSGRDVVASKEAGAPYHPPANRGAAPQQGERAEPNTQNARTPTHPNDLPPLEHPTAPNTGNAETDQKYQKQQQDLYQKQVQERQQLQQKQDQEHQQMEQQKASQPQRQQMEQRHQQQTQQMVQKHEQERQQLQAKQAQPKSRHK